MNENINIRRLISKDLNTFFNLRLEALLNSPTAFLASYEEEKSLAASFYEKPIMQNKIGNLILGAFIDQNLIGFIGVYQEEKQKTKHKANIWGMYVQPSYRNQGVGKMLMDNLFAYIRNNLNSVVINISVEASNLAAKKLYESYGFKTWGIEPKAMKINDEFYDEAHMALSITD
jgi:ribosomal protein S18 acetylase RimI-like enzyme